MASVCLKKAHRLRTSWLALSSSLASLELLSSVQDGICVFEKAPMCSTPSQKFPSRYLWNGSSVWLINDAPLSSFQGRLSRASSFHTSLLQAISCVTSLALCLQVVSQASQHLRLTLLPWWSLVTHHRWQAVRAGVYRAGLSHFLHGGGVGCQDLRTLLSVLCERCERLGHQWVGLQVGEVCLCACVCGQGSVSLGV